ncbi:unnamed protein product [Peronospora farinosa]|uniref:Guanylate-binding protein N-terminal domain-containing protein n=1 Tax=Peronospora farinosa TaxID=134698 RepID=A0AAV0UN65_9STRA|nr:unnamed protein product [Peronospora farinosa]
MATTTWHGVELMDAFGSLTSDGARLLEKERHDEHLAVVLFTNEDVVALCGEGLVLLASIASIEEDVHVLILDVNTSETGESLEQFIGAFCVLSSLVVSCYDDIGSTQCIVPFLPPFQSLYQTLMREFDIIEVFEMLPKMMNIDLSPSHSLKDKLADTEKDERPSSVEALESLIRFKRVGLFYPLDIAQMNYDEFCGSHATVKRLFGLEMTGEMLAALLRKLSIQVFQHEPLDLGTAWDDFVEYKCRLLAEDALSTYVDCVHPSVLEHPPMELKAFTQLHEEIWRLSMDVYHSASKYRSTRYRTVRNKLKADIRAHYDTELGILTQTSRKFCAELRQTLWADLYTRAINSRDGDTFTAMLAAIQDFDKLFNEKARGPEKASVLRDFYQHEVIGAFKKLENVVTQQLSESRLEELRLQLETDFENKKMALVKHFKQEEAQLRAGMVRDMETMQKMHEAKAARVKIDGSEAKRLRDEINEMKRQNSELQEKTIVVEHTQQDIANQKAVLAMKVDELETAVHREIANRTEIVDTLALTIKNAEEKEKELHEKIAELQLELEEKTIRIKGELQDLTQQLRKTTEEKGELQKKLNEFFLKVTALPEGLQQHLFCMENGQVDFAEALTSFMSE